VVLGDDGEDARDADAVRPHRDRDQLAVLVEHLEAERLGVLAPELEDVADLHAPREMHGARAVGRGVALANVRGLDDPVPAEVTAGDEPEHVLLIEIGTRDPLGALDDARVDEVADAGR
jgi:hypothetical protein